MLSFFLLFGEKLVCVVDLDYTMNIILIASNNSKKPNNFLTVLGFIFEFMKCVPAYPPIQAAKAAGINRCQLAIPMIE